MQNKKVETFVSTFLFMFGIANHPKYSIFGIYFPAIC